MREEENKMLEKERKKREDGEDSSLKLKFGEGGKQGIQLGKHQRTFSASFE